jgi:hypothetical protein
VGDQRDLHFVVDVGPLGVVVQFFCVNGGAGHAAEGVDEILELVGFDYGVTVGGLRPAVVQKLRQIGDACVGA